MRTLNCQDVCSSILVQDTMFHRQFRRPGTNEIGQYYDPYYLELDLLETEVQAVCPLRGHLD